MPRIIEHPSRRQRVCEPCEFHRCIGALHVLSGAGGWRRYVCAHPEAFENTGNQKLDEMRQHISTFDGGRNIGKTESQPDWCPLLRELDEDKIYEGRPINYDSGTNQ